MTILMYFHCFFLKMLICVCVFNHTVYTEHSLLVFVFFFGRAVWLARSQFLKQGLNLGHRQ